jgi:hypothetical protein
VASCPLGTPRPGSLQGTRAALPQPARATSPVAQSRGGAHPQGAVWAVRDEAPLGQRGQRVLRSEVHTQPKLLGQQPLAGGIQLGCWTRHEHGERRVDVGVRLTATRARAQLGRVKHAQAAGPDASRGWVQGGEQALVPACTELSWEVQAWAKLGRAMQRKAVQHRSGQGRIEHDGAVWRAALLGSAGLLQHEEGRAQG